MTIFYFTFGQTHTHPSNGKQMRNFWIEIESDHYETARDTMNIRYPKWSMQYTASEFENVKKYFPYGCYEKLTQVN